MDGAPGIPITLVLQEAEVIVRSLSGVASEGGEGVEKGRETRIRSSLGSERGSALGWLGSSSFLPLDGRWWGHDGGQGVCCKSEPEWF